MMYQKKKARYVATVSVNRLNGLYIYMSLHSQKLLLQLIGIDVVYTSCTTMSMLTDVIAEALSRLKTPLNGATQTNLIELIQKLCPALPVSGSSEDCVAILISFWL